eukprot:TRINITY_DN8975_c0_g1_i1.p1 TRINITY_DN8975_c0_g1~~TRINITY_DN8975_c0_g1_i1.p1  ORF type:complete len:169 (+),score=39.91 TRINITY_DN8975_c0_g1_i1:44-550(+)
MLIYKDMLTNVEVISDSMDPKPLVHNGVTIEGVFECESRMVPEGGDIDVGSDESFDDDVELVNNIAHPFEYMEMGFGKKSEMMGYFKAYLKKAKGALEEAGKDEAYIKTFMKQAKVFVGWCKEMFKELQFYMSEACEPDALLIFTYYKEGAATPTFVYMNWALEEEKC